MCGRLFLLFMFITHIIKLILNHGNIQTLHFKLYVGSAMKNYIKNSVYHIWMKTVNNQEL